MADHVTRMVNGWFERAERAQRADAAQGQRGGRQLAATHLIDSIHRLIREAERETRERCEQLALEVMDSEHAQKLAEAIRSLHGLSPVANDGDRTQAHARSANDAE